MNTCLQDYDLQIPGKDLLSPGEGGEGGVELRLVLSKDVEIGVESGVS